MGTARSFGRFVARAAVATLVVAAFGCSKEPATGVGAAAVEKSAPPRWRIGATIDRLSNDYFVKIKQGIEARGQELGLAISVQDARGDDSVQLNQLENFMRQEVDAIIIAAVNDDVPAIEEAVRQARGRGIKVVAQSQRVKTADVYVSIRQHDYGAAGGAMAGAWIRDHKGGVAKVGVIGMPERATILERVQGLKDGLRQIAPQAEIVADIAAPTTEKAQGNTEAALQQNPALDVFLAYNDDSAIAAANALIAKAGPDAAKAKGRYAVFGLDAIPAALDALRDPASPLRGTVDIDPVGNGRKDVDVVVALLEGKPVPEAQSFEPAPGVTQSYVPVAMKAVTEPDAAKK